MVSASVELHRQQAGVVAGSHQASILGYCRRL